MNVRLLTFLKSEIGLRPGRERTLTVPSGHLAASAFDNEEDLKLMVDSFDKCTKPVFKDEKEVSYIKFGTMKDNDTAVNIHHGQLALSGQVRRDWASRIVC